MPAARDTTAAADGPSRVEGRERRDWPLPNFPGLAAWSDMADGAPLSALRGRCFTLRPRVIRVAVDDYIYELCLGDRLMQVQHPWVSGANARQVFGFFTGWGDVAPQAAAKGLPAPTLRQLYSEGYECPGWGLRNATVDFYCDPAATQELELVNVEETDVCRYRLSMVTPHAC